MTSWGQRSRSNFWPFLVTQLLTKSWSNTNIHWYCKLDWPLGSMYDVMRSNWGQKWPLIAEKRQSARGTFGTNFRRFMMVTLVLYVAIQPIGLLKVYTLVYSKRYFDPLKVIPNRRKNEFFDCTDLRASQCTSTKICFTFAINSIFCIPYSCHNHDNKVRTYRKSITHCHHPIPNVKTHCSCF